MEDKLNEKESSYSDFRNRATASQQNCAHVHMF